MTVSAIIAGAGSGTRLGANMPKALVKLAGEELIVHAVRSMNEAGIDDVIVTVPGDAKVEFESVLAGAGLTARCTEGGLTRQDSVARGLALVESNYVLVHDAARALTPVEQIQRVVGALKTGYRAVVPAMPVTDTIKRVRAKDPFEEVAANVRSGPSVEYVKKTVNRERLRAVQTPQGFDVELLRNAHNEGKKLSANEASSAPDDAALVEKLGVNVVFVPGMQEAMKITTPFDLEVAELIAARGGVE